MFKQTMSKNVAIVIAVVIVLVLAIFYFVSSPATAPDAGQTVAEQSVGAGAVDTGALVSGALAPANPFEKNLNPAEGYKNPFGN